MMMNLRMVTMMNMTLPALRTNRIKWQKMMMEMMVMQNQLMVCFA